jgi:rhamnosyltransferase
LKASVIIPTKNAGPLFKDVLRAVTKQNTPWTYEVLVIDSGSIDDTLRYCESYSSVELHRISPHEFGHGKTRNLGVSLTAGQFVVFLTQDALPTDEHWLNEIVKAADQSEDVAGAFGRQKAYPETSLFIARDLEAHFDGFLMVPHPVRLADRERYRREQGYRQLLHFFSNSNSCLRRSVWEEIPFPEVDFAEDQMWASKIIEAGYAKAYADKAVVYHSHDFGFWEQGRRSFDESYALYRIFGYMLGPSLPYVTAQAIRTTVSDFKYVLQRRQFLKQIKWVLKSPLRNTFRQFGFYLGQRADRLPLWIVNNMSRDQTLRRIGMNS